MKKSYFSKFKWNGQMLLLLTNALFLIAILTNYSLALNGNTALENNVETQNSVAAIPSILNSNNGLTDARFNEPLVGEISIFAGNFAPRGWAFCNGQLLSISKNTSLFSILGTTYGGDGRSTFGLPDLRGRIPIHAGQGPGLPQVRLGQKSNNSYLMPYFDDKYIPVLPPSTQAVNYIIALLGVYPSRS